MNNKDLANEILKTLKNYENHSISFGRESLIRLERRELESIDQKIKNPTRIRVEIERPVCPIVRGSSTGQKSLYGYKVKMCEYLRQWDLILESPGSISNGLLEALANFYGKN